MLRSVIITIITAVIFTACISSKKYKNIDYLESKVAKRKTPTLNVFSKKNKQKKPVIIFVHGGNWNSGNKELYSILGRNFAKKGIVAVIPGYSLSPNANYDDMARQIAAAFNWTKENIDNYEGDPEQIYLTGHSAGGHLVALVATNPKYQIEPEAIAGVILNDAAGLDMHHYLQNKKPTKNSNYITTWTKDPEVWKDASPIFYLDKSTPPFMIYLGSKTYKSITTANNRFLKALGPFQPNVEPIILKKKHIPMVTQYFKPWNKRYKEISQFIEK